MRKELLILTSFGLFQAAFALAQCPDRDALWMRLANLRFSKVPPKELLSGLLSTHDSMVNCGSKNDSTYIYLLRKIADVYVLQADYIKAVQYRRQAIEITVRNAGKSSVKVNSLPGIYYWLSVAYDSLDNFAERMNALDSCFTTALRLQVVDRSSLRALYTRVENFFDIGDYHRSINYAIKCEQLGREYADKNTGLEKSAGEQFASSSLGWHVEALLKLKEFEQAEVLLKNKVAEYESAGLKNYLGLVLGQLAQVYLNRGDYIKASLYYTRSYKYYQQNHDYFNCKQTLKDMGYHIYSRHFSDRDKALSFYRKALRYNNNDEYNATADKFESLSIFSNMGALYVQTGLYDSAFQYFQLAFNQIKSGATEEDILQSTSQQMLQFKRNYYLTELLINKAYAFKTQFEDRQEISSLNKAVRIYKMADQLLDRIKSEQTELESKLFWRSDSRRLYENAIEACYLQGNVRDAFYFFEKSRAVLLNDQLNENRFIAEKDIMRQTEIKKKIHQLQKELAKADKSSAGFSELQNELFSYKRELDNVKQAIKSKNPLYYQSFLDSAYVTIEELKAKILKDHGALVEIFTGDSAVYGLLLTEQTTRLKRIDKANYDTLSRSFLSYISNFDLLNRDYEGFRKISGELYQLIFGDMLLPAGRLIISPDGQYFPFEALVINKPGQPLKWFLEDYAVSYTYSARFLMNDFKSAKNSSRNFLGMAPVNFPLSYSLAALPGSDRSLDKIADYFRNGVSWLKMEASRKNFLEQFSQYRIIQLYTHASDNSVNNEPVIYFSDSALYLSDLINEYEPYTQLIVLSACETGQGKIYQGEGVFSFNRGFAALGIPAAITNLWSVDNGATYLLTELFYKWIAKGLPTDVALQKAKLEFLQTSSKEKSLPCYWAGPVLVGKSDAIAMAKSYPWEWIAVFAAFGLIVTLIMRKKFTQKQVSQILFSYGSKT